MTSTNNRALLLHYVKLCASFETHRWIQTGVTVRKRSIRVKIGNYLGLMWPWQMALKNNRAPLLYSTKLYASFQKSWVNSNLSYSPETPNLGQNGRFFSCVNLKFDRWPWKTIGYLFLAASSFVHHCIAISKFKLELQSGNIQFGSKSMTFLAVWPWNLTNDLEKQ